MILLVFATLTEAKGTIQALRAVECHPSVYRWSKGRIVISGMGCIQAATAVGLYGQEADTVINVGIAGALNPEIPLGTMCSIQTVAKHTLLPEAPLLHTVDLVQAAFPHHDIGSKGTGCRLISSDYPVYDPMTRQRLSSFDLVDMEGYGVASACHALQKQCRIYKKISDLADSIGSSLIKKHLGRYSEEIGKEIIDLMLREG